MKVPDEPFPECIPCIVLRQAGYQAGTWLLSDRHPTLTLFDHAALEAIIRHAPARAKVADLYDLPYVVLDRPFHPDGRETAVARPLAPGAYAFGGDWLWSDDARFPGDHPIPIHDSPVSSQVDDQPANS